MFGSDQKFSPYYDGALCFFKLEQLFRSGDVDSSLNKAIFQLMKLARMIDIGVDLEQLNSNKIEKRTESLISTLLDENKALALFEKATKVFIN